MLSGKNYQEDKLDLATDPAPARARRSSRSSWRPRSSRACRRRRSTRAPHRSAARCGRTTTTASPTPKAAASGKVDLWTATENSINVVFAQLILDIGPETVPPVANEDGHDRPSCRRSPRSRPVPRRCHRSTWRWGTPPSRNGGIHCTPYTVETIVRDGDELYQHEADCERVLRPDIAHLITRDAGARAAERHRRERLLGWGDWPVAGKTGTAGPEHERVVLRLHAAGRHRGVGGLQRQPVLASGRCSAGRSRRRSGATTCSG